MSVDVLVEDLSADLQARPYEIAKSGDGWLLRTRAAYVPAIRAAADQTLDLNAHDITVLVVIAYHQPLSRDLIGWLSERGLIAPGPREPRCGAAYTFVTTDAFLTAFDLSSLADLPDQEQLHDAGLVPGRNANHANTRSQ